MRFNPRWLPIVLATILSALIGLIAAHQVPVMLYKQALVLLAGVDGYLVDWAVFYYAQPSGYLDQDWHAQLRKQGWGHFVTGGANFPVAKTCEQLFLWACVRRAALMGFAMLAVGLGL